MSAGDSRPPTPPPEFTWIAGRGYKRGSNPAYAFPNDAQEPERLEAQHQLIAHSIGRNFLAPVADSLRSGCKVLDAGCGTGIWSVEMALEFPQSEFHATDVVDLFDGMVANGAPGNVRFGLADTLKGLPFEDGIFDYCFQRLHGMVWRETEWAKVIAELVRVTKPGGWIELIDIDGLDHNGGLQTSKFFNMFRTLLSLRGINPTYFQEIPQVLEAAGVENVSKVYRSLPVGWGPPETSTLSLDHMKWGLEAVKPHIWVALGIGDEEYDTMIAEALREMESEGKMYYNVYVVWGRKPLVENAETLGEDHVVAD